MWDDKWFLFSQLWSKKGVVIKRTFFITNHYFSRVYTMGHYMWWLMGLPHVINQ